MVQNFHHKKASKSYDRSFIVKTVMVVALVSFLPMLLVSGLILDQFSNSYNEELFAHLKELVHKHSLEIDNFLNQRLKNIQFLADSCGFENLFDESVLEEKLFKLQQKYGDIFVDLGIINTAGVQEYYAGLFKLENARYSDAQWFIEASKNHSYISDVFLGLRGNPHFIVSVKNQHQGKDYLLRATINFSAFSDLAENLRIGKTGFAFIVSRDGALQTKPHYDMPEKKISYSDFIKAGAKGKHEIYVGQFRNPTDGEIFIYVAALLKNEDWVLVYRQEKAEAFADLHRAQIIAAVIIFIGALSIALMTLIFFHKSINRIAEVDREKEMMSRQIVETGKLASVGELAAGIAHEINNPVAIMVQEAGWIEDLLEEDDFKEGKNLKEFRSSLEQVKNQGKRCKEITHKLLSFARKTNPKIEKVQINKIIEEVVAITDMAAYTRIFMETHLAKNLPPIDGSQTEIEQVLINLINNAIYALEKDGGKIDITSRMEHKYVLVIVEDNGPGIPEAYMERIFDPFFTTKPVGKGSGLGLSICFGIINKMGGEIDVHSTIDEGTRFELRFPLENMMALSADDQAALTTTEPGSMTPSGERGSKRNIKLLLVDDEKNFVKVLSKRMSRRNFDVITTFSGEEAIQALRKVDFDAAVLDLKMPDMDGLEVLKIFKKMYPKMEVVILSGHDSEQSAREGIKYGAFDYLAKPCDIDNLIDTIRKSVSDKK